MNLLDRIKSSDKGKSATVLVQVTLEREVVEKAKAILSKHDLTWKALILAAIEQLLEENK